MDTAPPKTEKRPAATSPGDATRAEANEVTPP
jgi:hypothetical protein